MEVEAEGRGELNGLLGNLNGEEDEVVPVPRVEGEEVAEEDNQDKGQKEKKTADQKKNQKKTRKEKAWAATKAGGRSFRDTWNDV